jgi:hypothetical protein
VQLIAHQAVGQGVMAGSLCRHVAISTALTAALLTSRAQSQSVKIELEGIVPISCKLDTGAAQITLGNIAATGSKNISFRVRCNTPFQFAISSRDGGLKTPHNGPLNPDFTAAIPYSATVQIPTNVGTLAGSCPSAMLKGMNAGCLFPDSGQGVALAGEASLGVAWNILKEPIAGTYSDQLTLSIAPKL